MGLDGVELLMDVEETFGVAIDDDTATSVRTVGDLYEVLRAGCRTQAKPNCLTSAAFYQLRPVLCTVDQLDRIAIRPHTTLESALPRRRRRRSWAEVTRASGLRLPRLKRPEWLGTLLTSITLAGLVLGTAGIPTGSPSIVAVGWSAALFVVLVFFLTTPLAVEIPLALSGGESTTNGPPSLGDFVRRVAVDNRVRLAARQRAWHDREIWDTLVTLVAKNLGVAHSLVVPSSRFVEDLGMG